MNSALYNPQGQMQIADFAKQVKVVRFERSGHAPFMNEPRKFIRVIGDFLANQ